MIVLISHHGKAHEQRCNAEPETWGNLVTPRCYCRLAQTKGAIGVDNDRFNSDYYDEKKFLRTLDKVAPYQKRVVFVAAPDVVCDAKATLEEFVGWGALIRGRGFPVALVLQNGVENIAIDWDSFDAIFIGGDDEWKDGDGAITGRYRHARFMPRWASRLTLEITDIRVERLNDISEEDSIAEGIERMDNCWRNYTHNSKSKTFPDAVTAWGLPVVSFQSLWESINSADSWAANPWVWVLKFKRVEEN